MLWSRRLSCISQLTADRAKRRSEGPNRGCLDCYEIAWTTATVLLLSGHPCTWHTTPRLLSPRRHFPARTSWLAGHADADALQVIVTERPVGVEALEQVS